MPADVTVPARGHGVKVNLGRLVSHAYRSG
jgi:hypothetical protein